MNFISVLGEQVQYFFNNRPLNCFVHSIDLYLKIKLGTWGTAEGKWFYDCENDSSGNNLAPIKQNLTDSQRLARDLLKEYDPNIVPLDLNSVMLDFDLANANFNAKKSFMTSRGRFRVVNL